MEILMNKYNLIIFIILIFDFQFTYGQDYIPDSVRGIIIADSIVNSKNILSVKGIYYQCKFRIFQIIQILKAEFMQIKRNP